MEDLLCSENLNTDRCTAGRDATMYTDSRVLANLMLSEERNGVPPEDYFISVQTDIKPYIRKIVNSWMQEVCDERQCEYQVFPYAVSIMDRFLCFCPLEKTQLQLAACACLLIASKIRECHALCVEDLVYYSDHTFSPHLLKKMELLVICKIRWNLSTVTASDFLDHILERVSWSKDHPLVRQHALTLINTCYTEYEFMMFKPSLIASGCILAAYNGLLSSTNSRPTSNQLAELTALTQHATSDVTNVSLLVEKIIQRETETNSMSNQSTSNSNKSSQQHSSKHNTTSNNNNSHTKEKPDTPIDVQDVRF
uniref:G1/S-specific cyclin-D3 n=1 Tax=Cacopsylla melanoneura TaxID=428564 RepID=A0A8D8WNR9_9HEMI